MSTEANYIVRRLAEADPTVHNPEGADYCHFCDTERRYYPHDQNNKPQHTDDCLWVQANRLIAEGKI